jgi:hypothetical protein
VPKVTIALNTRTTTARSARRAFQKQIGEGKWVVLIQNRKRERKRT